MKLPPGLVNNFSFSFMANIFAPLFLPIPSSESDLLSAVALVAIALGFCSLKKESNFFNECVEEIKATGSPTADSVRFCTGG